MTKKHSLTTTDLAVKYQYTVKYIREMAKKGEIPSIKTGRGKIRKEYRFNAEDIAKAMAGRVLQLENTKNESAVDGEIDDLGV